MAIVEDARAGLRAARAGATVIQLRAPGVALREVEAEAELLVEISPVPVLVSSRADLALAVGAAGVNLPEGDLPVAAARRLLGTERLVGRSVHSLEGALEATEAGASFLLYGPVFETPSHPGRPGVGLEALARVAEAVLAGGPRGVPVPVLAVGGINRARAGHCLEAGAAGYAAIGMFQAHPW